MFMLPFSTRFPADLVVFHTVATAIKAAIVPAASASAKVTGLGRFMHTSAIGVRINVLWRNCLALGTFTYTFTIYSTKLKSFHSSCSLRNFFPSIAAGQLARLPVRFGSLTRRQDLAIVTCHIQVQCHFDAGHKNTLLWGNLWIC